jgi:hypothetical protein
MSHKNQEAGKTIASRYLKQIIPIAISEGQVSNRLAKIVTKLDFVQSDVVKELFKISGKDDQLSCT